MSVLGGSPGGTVVFSSQTSKPSTTRTINDWLLQHHHRELQQQQRQQLTSADVQRQSGPVGVVGRSASRRQFVDTSDALSSHLASSGTTADYLLDLDFLTELTESERDYRMDQRKLTDASGRDENSSASFAAAMNVNGKVFPLPPAMGAQNSTTRQHPSLSADKHQLPVLLDHRRRTAYDNMLDVNEVEATAGVEESGGDIHLTADYDNISDIVDEDGFLLEDRRRLDEMLKMCAEYAGAAMSVAGSSSGTERETAEIANPPRTSASPPSQQSAPSPPLRQPRLDPLPTPSTSSPRSSRLSPTAVSGSSSPGVSSKIKTNGSLTSPVNGRRSITSATIASSPSSCVSGDIMTSMMTDFLAPCWLETPATRAFSGKTPNGCDLFAASGYRIDRGLSELAGSGESRDGGDDWSGGSLDDLSDSDRQQSSNRRSPTMTADKVTTTTTSMTNSDHPPKTADGRQRCDGNEKSSCDRTRLDVIKQRLSDVEELEEKAIQEVTAELEAVDVDMANEMKELEFISQRLEEIKQQQMVLLLAAAKEREEADRQLTDERRRLQSMERQLRETKQRLRKQTGSRDNHVEDVAADVEAAEDFELLRSTLSQQQESTDTQRRIVDDLEFQLLEMETKREAEREPLQRKLTTERDKLLELSSSKKKSIAANYLQKMELLAQAKVDIADLGKEYQLLMDSYEQETRHVDNNDDVANSSMRGTSPSSWKQGNLWRTLIELEARIVNERPTCTDDGDINACETLAGTGDQLRQQPVESRDTQWCAEFNGSERSSDDVSCGGLSRDRDTGISSSGNTLDDLDTFADITTNYSGDLATGTDNDNVCPTQGGSGTLLTQHQNGDTTLRDSHDDSWNHSNESVCINGHVTNGTDTIRSTCTDTVVIYRDKKSPYRQSRPLTRYLPVRDGSQSTFNLRQFVESAGHVIDDRPEAAVHVTPVACHGWLVKMAGGRRRSGLLAVWHRRYFLFDRTWRTLSWYSERVNPSTIAPPGVARSRYCIKFESIVDVFVDHLQRAGRRSPAPSLTFCVKARGDRCLYLVAPTPEAMRIWIDVLVTGAEGYGEFW